MKIFIPAQSPRSILLYQPYSNGILTAGGYVYYRKTTVSAKI
jgi:hypothetical protein